MHSNNKYNIKSWNCYATQITKSLALQDFRHRLQGNDAGLFPSIMPRCEEPIENLHLSCGTDEASGGTPQSSDWDVMNDTELYVRTSELNVTMMFNVSHGMPIYFNISNNGSIETELKREIGSGKNTLTKMISFILMLEKYLYKRCKWWLISIFDTF